MLPSHLLPVPLIGQSPLEARGKETWLMRSVKVSLLRKRQEQEKHRVNLERQIEIIQNTDISDNETLSLKLL